MKENEVIDPVLGGANVVRPHNGHHGICDVSEGKASAGCAKGSNMINVAEACETDDKIGLLGWFDGTAMEGCINVSVAACVLGGESMTMVDTSWKEPQSQLRVLVSILELRDGQSTSLHG